MPPALRQSGLPEIGGVPWGTHFCLFYETKRDLLDLLVPYFKAGLEDNEFCVWVAFDPISIEEVREAIVGEIPGGARHLRSGNIEVHSYQDWFVRDGILDATRLQADWGRKLAEALDAGFDGMRANGTEAWVSDREWRIYEHSERQLNELVKDQRTVVACTYPLRISTASRVFDVARFHSFVIARRHGTSETLESPELRRTNEALQSLSEQLEHRVIERTLSLSLTNEHLRALSARIEAAKEEEAARIAREIHDRMGSGITSLRWRLEALEGEMQAGGGSEAAKLADRLTEIREEADRLADTVKRIASEIRPSELEDLGLIEAIEAQARQFQERSGIETEFENEQSYPPDLDMRESAALFRIVEEALNNVRQHSMATRARITLRLSSGRWLLAISDNGQGITEAARSSRKSLGIWSMRERAHGIDAQFDIQGSPAGTTIEVRVPARNVVAAERN